MLYNVLFDHRLAVLKKQPFLVPTNYSSTDNNQIKIPVCAIFTSDTTKWRIPITKITECRTVYRFRILSCFYLYTNLNACNNIKIHKYIKIPR